MMKPAIMSEHSDQDLQVRIGPGTIPYKVTSSGLISYRKNNSNESQQPDRTYKKADPMPLQVAPKLPGKSNLQWSDEELAVPGSTMRQAPKARAPDRLQRNSGPRESNERISTTFRDIDSDESTYNSYALRGRNKFLNLTSDSSSNLIWPEDGTSAADDWLPPCRNKAIRIKKTIRGLSPGSRSHKSSQLPFPTFSVNATRNLRPYTTGGDDRQRTDSHHSASTTNRTCKVPTRATREFEFEDGSFSSSDDDEGGVKIDAEAFQLSTTSHKKPAKSAPAGQLVITPWLLTSQPLGLISITHKHFSSLSRDQLKGYQNFQEHFHSHPEFLAEVGGMIQELNMNGLVSNYLFARNERIRIGLVQLSDAVKKCYVLAFGTHPCARMMTEISVEYSRFCGQLEALFRRLYEELEALLLGIPTINEGLMVMSNN